MHPTVEIHFSPLWRDLSSLIITNNSSPSHPTQSVCNTAERRKAKHVTAHGCVVKLRMCMESSFLSSYREKSFPGKAVLSPGASEGRGQVQGHRCAGRSGGTSKSGWEAWTNQDMSLREQNPPVQIPAPHAACGTLNYTQVLHSHCIRSPDMSKTELIRANLKQPNIITLHCAMHKGAVRHKHFMPAFTNKCIWSLLSSRQKSQQHAAQLKQLLSSAVSLKTTVQSSIQIIKTE